VKDNPVLSAVFATVLFTGTLGVLTSVASFGALRILNQMAEALGILPARWGENNVFLLMELAGLLSIPIIAWFAVWFYRRAITHERQLQGYKYVPPPR
jgi:hypothetical protein